MYKNFFAFLIFIFVSIQAMQKNAAITSFDSAAPALSNNIVETHTVLSQIEQKATIEAQKKAEIERFMREFHLVEYDKEELYRRVQNLMEGFVEVNEPFMVILPGDVWYLIFCNISAQDLIKNLMLVCKQFYRIIHGRFKLKAKICCFRVSEEHRLWNVVLLQRRMDALGNYEPIDETVPSQLAVKEYDTFIDVRQHWSEIEQNRKKMKFELCWRRNQDIIGTIGICCCAWCFVFCCSGICILLH